MMMDCMNMPGMGGMMAVGGVAVILLIALQALGVAALTKYLFFGSQRRTNSAPPA